MVCSGSAGREAPAPGKEPAPRRLADLLTGGSPGRRRPCTPAAVGAGLWHPFRLGGLYTTQLPAPAGHVLNRDVLPFFERHQDRTPIAFSGHGREICGRPDRQPDEVFLRLEEIKHRATPVRRPRQGLNLKGRTRAQALRDGLPTGSRGGTGKALELQLRSEQAKGIPAMG